MPTKKEGSQREAKTGGAVPARQPVSVVCTSKLWMADKTQAYALTAERGRVKLHGSSVAGGIWSLRCLNHSGALGYSTRKITRVDDASDWSPFHGATGRLSNKSGAWLLCENERQLTEHETQLMVALVKDDCNYCLRLHVCNQRQWSTAKLARDDSSISQIPADILTSKQQTVQYAASLQRNNATSSTQPPTFQLNPVLSRNCRIHSGLSATV
jgi:hypothetical protein